MLSGFTGAVIVGLTIAGVTAAGTVGLLFKGAPTEISHLWPGWPCGGIIPGATVCTTGYEFILA